MADRDPGRVNALPKVIPERIRDAREGRGLTSEAFGDLLGVSRQAVAQYESGQIGPSADVLSRIISITRQPSTFFTESRPRKAQSLSSPFWRSLKRMDQAARIRIVRRLDWASDVVEYIESFIELPKADFPDLQWDHVGGSDDDIEDIALRMRVDWNLGYGPIHDLVSLLEYHGAILVREEVRCEDMDAVSRWQGGRPYVLYSSEVKSQPRVNLNLAHELGHIILHSGVDVNKDNLAKIERQANRFAGAFLLPRRTFPNEVISTSLHYFQTLKQRWRVSIAAMVYRCKDLSILSDSQVRYLWRQMNVMGIRRIEPLDDAFEHVAPRVIRASLNMLVDNHVQTKEEIERGINLNPEDIESIGGADSGWLTASRVVAFTPRPQLRPERK